MKTLVKLLFFVVCLGHIVSCCRSDKFVEEIPDAELKSANVSLNHDAPGLYH